MAQHDSISVEHGGTGQFLRQYELVERMRSYNDALDEDLINRAYVFAMVSHGTQTRHSGDPYFAHPVSVAGILANLRLDEAVIAAGLLHDVVEDTEVTTEDICQHFGEVVADIVEGVTKLSEFDYTSEETKQAENFQKFILASIKDIRVLLVKLADRLHNMRTMHFVPKAEKRLRITRETMDIYVPLARRLGLYEMATEFEDICFSVLNPEARSAILLRLEESLKVSQEDIDNIKKDIGGLLNKHGITHEIHGRLKKPYSIWRKLERQSISFRDVADIYAVRVLVKDITDCYRVLGLTHQEWACLPDRFRDFISVPKPNGYRSLHTTIRGPAGRRVELQIRTEEMHQIAEFGVAAHWGYKNEAYGFDAEAAKQGGLDTDLALTAFAEMIKDGGDVQDFFDHAKLEMYRDFVFVFTPKGRLIVLPAGGMPLDFAFALHTEIGLRCEGVTINGASRALSTPLQNGDVVEVTRSVEPVVNPAWENLVITGRAKSAIRRHLRDAERGQFAQIGERMLRHALQDNTIVWNDQALEEVALELGERNLDRLTRGLGRGRVKLDQVVKRLKPKSNAIETPSIADAHKRPQIMITGRDLDNRQSALDLASCCGPIPGDRIVGIMDEDKGISVHSIDCMKLVDYEARPDIWIDLKWLADAKNELYGVGHITLWMENKPGALAILCEAIAKQNGNIVKLETGQIHPDFAEIHVDIIVSNTTHLSTILTNLRAIKGVDRANRRRDTEQEADSRDMSEFKKVPAQ